MKNHTFLKQRISKIELEALKYLQEMVNTNSYTRNRQGVLKVAELCQQMFCPLGFQAETVPDSNPHHGDHLFLTRPGKGEYHICLISHLDTVYTPEEEKENDFAWREEGRWIYGPGVVDIKGGTTVIYMAMKTLQQQEPALFEQINWSILFNAAEEEGSANFHPLVRQKLCPQTLACLVYEQGEALAPGASDFVEARKGAIRLRLEAFGRQAHSGTCHHKGANAIWELAEKVVAIQNLTNYQRGVTINVGRIEGGVVHNRVPDYAYCDIDIRVQDKDGYQWVLAEVNKITETAKVKSAADGFSCKVKLHHVGTYPPWPRNSRSHSLAQKVVECGQTLGLNLCPVWRNGSSDACYFWEQAPTIDGLGPVGQNCHCSIHAPEEGKEQEVVDRHSFVTRTLLSVTLIKEIYQQARCTPPLPGDN